MRNARFSVLVWGVYVLVLGVFLVLAPEVITGLVGVDDPQDVWLQVAGAPVIVLGIYYIGAARNDSQWLYSYSVLARYVAALALAYLAITEGPWQVWIFAGADALGATWTYLALRPPKPVEPVGDPTPGEPA